MPFCNKTVTEDLLLDGLDEISGATMFMNDAPNVLGGSTHKTSTTATPGPAVLEKVNGRVGPIGALRKGFVRQS
jgi:hypothetical protein